MDFELEIDPALAAAVLEIEKHHADAGWDQPARLYALVDTAALVAHEPALASALGLDEPRERGSLTPVEQEAVTAGQELEEFLPSVSWPAGVVGCAAVVERLVLPPHATSVFIAADHDANGIGECAARNAADRWLAEGRRVRIVLPPVPGSDWNDVLLNKDIREANHAA